MISTARARLPKLPLIQTALDNLQVVMDQTTDLNVSIDLADLRGYHYHNGLVFAAYCEGYPAAIAMGGRYDGAGAAFGRARPATGFSTDLRELARLSLPVVTKAAILSPHVAGDLALLQLIESLRASGEVVVEQLPGDIPCDGPICDRQLVLCSSGWTVELR